MCHLIAISGSLRLFEDSGFSDLNFILPGKACSAIEAACVYCFVCTWLSRKLGSLNEGRLFGSSGDVWGGMWGRVKK